MQVYRVLLAEDRVIHRLYLEQVIRGSGRYTLVGTEPNMEEAVKRCRHTPIDLILMAAADKEGNTNFAAAEAFKRVSLCSHRNDGRYAGAFLSAEGGRLRCR